MGDHKVNVKTDNRAKIDFLSHLMDDIKSLEYMFKEGMIEDDIIRIGAEQEFCLVNKEWRPDTNSLKVLEEINDPHFTTELARYNLEINLDPIQLSGDAFAKVEHQIRSLLEKAKVVANKNDSKIILTGILPSISKHELGIEYMTPFDRYYALNELFKEARGGEFKLHLLGVDELSILHNSVMFEACNTSFQMHLQIDPKDFMSSYNWAQAIAGPVLGACVNSPMLLGKELWSETRIALFQQSIDTRAVSMAQTEQESRVSFGHDWMRGSIVDYYKNEMSHFKTLLTKEIEKSSLEELKEGKIPKLSALNLLNGTIYRWNRPCYGVGNGKPHIRIENRYIPSGPTVLDEMANFAFWIGLMRGRPTAFDDLPRIMDFRDVRSNFIRAARTGCESVMNWMGKPIPIDELILDELLPISRKGLEKMEIDPKDINRYLNVIKARVQKQTGSRWMIRNYRNIKEKLKPNDALMALTEAMHHHQSSENPVSEWPVLHDFTSFTSTASKVGHIMTTDLVTACETDLAILTLKFMKWNHIHHLPVVDNKQTLVGLITSQHLKKYWDQVHDTDHLSSAREIMVKEVITVKTTTPIKEAIQLMRKHEIGCLPVLEDTQLVGIITIKDIAHLEDVENL
ncbi:CBS domain-containing protein [Dokdonia ponticola]|uniref:CBS domain-containing protein n=1 Tax=Dokdonia ponticola TaxID=2041041 RepID=A0ABV9HWH4_9FLAO